eukprot:TRINITY_DN3243_c0_g1_i1.p1 TRINITY_DN3243_c0_g1~~TRINITY_DN3243_c0_g1_i1.p1  ORF type:complete len:820 (-),score=234.11 TRINITY_DN3243_c0_g1_i1:28-2487(-)
MNTPSKSSGSGSGGSKTSSSTMGGTSTSSMSQGGGGVNGGSFWDNIFEGDEDEEGFVPGDSKEQYSWKDCIIFLIDCSSAMFEPTELDEIPFQNALRCVLSTLSDKIISSENDVLGVCFYNTDKKHNMNDFEHIYVQSELDVPDAQRIVDLENLLTKDFDAVFGHNANPSEFPFSDALWTCSTMFSACPIKVAHRRIFLFTNEDDPNGSLPNLREQAIQRARDIAELNIDIELFSMNKNGEHFDFTKFYQHIISFPEDEEGNIIFDPAAKFEELRARVRRKEFKKRTLGKLPLMIGNNITLATKVYSLVQETKKSSYIWLEGKTNQPVKTMTKWICGDTGSLLLDSQIKHFTYYGGEQIVFDKEELASSKNIDSQGIKILGFKPRSSLKVHYNIKHAQFIYPDDKEIKGSTVAFSALLDRMLASEKIAIARVIMRSGGAPRLAALLPSQGQNDVDGSMLYPQGLHVIPLPYADDLRALKLDPKPKDLTTDQIKAAKRIVKTLRINFDSRNFENPSLQKHYASLQALALDRDILEPVNDYVLPDEEGMLKYKDTIMLYKNAVYTDGYDYVEKLTPYMEKKRKLEEGIDPSPKRPKGPLSSYDWSNIVESGQINKLTIPELKSVLRVHKVKMSSLKKKADYIDAVKELLEGDDFKVELLTGLEEGNESGNEGESKPKKSKKGKEKVKEEEGEGEGGGDTEPDEESEAPAKKAKVNKGKGKEKESEKEKHRDNDIMSTDEEEEEELLHRHKKSNNNNNNGGGKSKSGDHSDSSSFVKREKDSQDDRYTPSQTTKSRPLCRYGEACYQTNPKHLADFAHPHKE